MHKFWQTIKDKLTKIDYFFLGFIVFMALFFTFAIPPMQKPDEEAHYYKSVNMAYGNFSCNQKKTNPVNLSIYNLPNYLNYKELLGHWENRFSTNVFENVKNNFNKNMGVVKCEGLPPYGYLLSGLVMRVNFLFLNYNSSILGFYLARLINLFFFFFAIIIGLYLIPKNYKLLLFSFLLFPMLLHQAGAISYDSFLNSLILIIFSYLINLTLRFKEKNKVEKKEFFIILLILTIASLVKSGYYLLFFLIFLLPFWKLFKNKIVYFFSVVGCLILIIFSFSFTSKNISSNEIGHVIVFGPNKSGYVSVREQIEFIEANPLFLRNIIIDTSFNRSDVYFMSLIGVFGALDIQLPFFVAFLFISIVFTMIIFQIFITKKESLFNWKQLWLLFVITFGTISLIIFSFYFIWTPVGASIIEGVQGRYFLPLLPFMFLFLVELVKKVGLRKFANYFVISSLLATALFSVYVVYQRYWDYQELTTIKTILKEE